MNEPSEPTDLSEVIPESDRLPRGAVPDEAARIARSLELAKAAARAGARRRRRRV